MLFLVQRALNWHVQNWINEKRTTLSQWYYHWNQLSWVELSWIGRTISIWIIIELNKKEEITNQIEIVNVNALYRHRFQIQHRYCTYLMPMLVKVLTTKMHSIKFYLTLSLRPCSTQNSYVENSSELSNYISDQADSWNSIFSYSNFIFFFFLLIEIHGQALFFVAHSLKSDICTEYPTAFIQLMSCIKRRQSMTIEFCFFFCNPVASCVNFQCISFVLEQSSIPSYSLHMWLFRTFVKTNEFFYIFF